MTNLPLPPEVELGHRSLEELVALGRGLDAAMLEQSAAAGPLCLSASKAERLQQIRRRISESDSMRPYLDELPRCLAGRPGESAASAEGRRQFEAGKQLVKHLFATTRTALSSGVAPGSSMVPSDVADAILDLVEVGGAHSTLRVNRAPSGKTVFTLESGDPTAVYTVPASQGSQLTAGAITASSLSTESNDLTVLMEIANSVLEDSRIDLSLTVAERCAAAIAKSLDWACFSADGTNDTTDGAQTGIFAHGSVPTVECTTAALAEDIEQEDLLRLIDGVSVAAIQRGPRFWVHPSIYRKLLRIADASGHRLVEFSAGEPFLLGYPVTMVAQAPSTNAAGQKVLAFGCGQGYVVAIRRSFTVRSSESGPSFTSNNSLMLCSTRAKCAMADASMFATLKLKAA